MFICLILGSDKEMSPVTKFSKNVLDSDDFAMPDFQNSSFPQIKSDGFDLDFFC